MRATRNYYKEVAGSGRLPQVTAEVQARFASGHQNANGGVQEELPKNFEPVLGEFR